MDMGLLRPSEEEALTLFIEKNGVLFDTAESWSSTFDAVRFRINERGWPKAASGHRKVGIELTQEQRDAAWLASCRADLKRGQLEQDRADALRSLPGWYDDPIASSVLPKVAALLAFYDKEGRWPRGKEAGARFLSIFKRDGKVAGAYPYVDRGAFESRDPSFFKPAARGVKIMSTLRELVARGGEIYADVPRFDSVVQKLRSGKLDQFRSLDPPTFDQALTLFGNRRRNNFVEKVRRVITRLLTGLTVGQEKVFVQQRWSLKLSDTAIHIAAMEDAVRAIKGRVFFTADLLRSVGYREPKNSDEALERIRAYARRFDPELTSRLHSATSAAVDAASISAPALHKWKSMFADCITFVGNSGRLPTGGADSPESERHLYRWLMYQRQCYNKTRKAGSISPSQISDLESIQGWSWSGRRPPLRERRNIGAPQWDEDFLIEIEKAERFPSLRHGANKTLYRQVGVAKVKWAAEPRRYRHEMRRLEDTARRFGLSVFSAAVLKAAGYTSDVKFERFYNEKLKSAVRQIMERTGLSKATIEARIRRGMPVDQAGYAPYSMGMNNEAYHASRLVNKVVPYLLVDGFPGYEDSRSRSVRSALDRASKSWTRKNARIDSAARCVEDAVRASGHSGWLDVATLSDIRYEPPRSEVEARTRVLQYANENEELRALLKKR